jgi:histidinol-phosphate aminotransferase
MIGPAPKATILEISPYVAGRASAAGFAKPIKLSANENALGCSPAARAAYLEAAEAIHLYPDPRATALREALARKYDLDPARIIFGTGSDELFSLACQAYLSPGQAMLQPQYAFAAWAIAARASGARVVSAPEKSFTVDVDAMLAAVDAQTRVVFVANPANPTGTVLPFSEIERLHAGLPGHALLVLDCAYAEFAEGAPGYADGLALARRAENVLVTRTFSKLHGLAALRLGWGYAAQPIAEALNRIRLPFNAPTPAQAAALAALADDDFAARSIAHAVAGRAALTRFFAQHGLEPIEGAANFVTVRFGKGAPVTAAAFENGLAARGVLVRGLGNYGLPDAVRVTIGADEEMARFRAAAAEVLGA